MGQPELKHTEIIRGKKTVIFIVPKQTVELSWPHQARALRTHHPHAPSSGVLHLYITHPCSCLFELGPLCAWESTHPHVSIKGSHLLICVCFRMAASVSVSDSAHVTTLKPCEFLRTTRVFMVTGSGCRR